MANNILVIEDEEKIARLLQLELTHAGYTVEIAMDGSEGLQKASQGLWDLILLDILLPVHNGFELIKAFRAANNETPIIVVTACKTTEDIVNGFDLGGHDYVTKPFHMEELLARIRACIRHHKRLHDTGKDLKHHDFMAYSLKETTINLRTRQVMQYGKNIDLTPKEFELLLYFIEHQNEVLSREQIMNDVWGYDFLGNSNLVDVYIRYLRKKLLAPYPVIKTIRGTGYCLEVSGDED
ncbi:response regulator transcription factor [Paenibacillus planticolens]|uniref:Response regulator n=1 Tax=Paenibacillus planticolens TaxID=2654976 RepID=A0ABX1ZVL7_9BACL|nr:response regulator transcription factor [Paenibacillus planticolens]NOV03866.1 response regulator [Paenibacillus planticolens]